MIGSILLPNSSQFIEGLLLHQTLRRSGNTIYLFGRGGECEAFIQNASYLKLVTALRLKDGLINYT